MILTANYAQTLRAIGQDLEGKHPKSLNLVVTGGSYFTRGRAGSGPFLRSFELRYTPGDIDRLEREGLAKRMNSTGMPDFLSLSQILRAVGCYVDLKNGYLKRVSRENQSLTVEYVTGLSQHNREVCPTSHLYDFCVRMYIQRSCRNQSTDIETG
jgi:hypothetical protein